VTVNVTQFELFSLSLQTKKDYESNISNNSFAQHYLNRPGATVNGLASLMARSHNTIATYLKQLTRDEEIAEMVDDMPI